MVFLATKVATAVAALYAGAANVVAAFSVIEIGPNLLAAVTSIIGAIVLIVQIWVARGVKNTKEVVKEHHQELKDAVTAVDKTAHRVEELENGGTH